MYCWEVVSYVSLLELVVDVAFGLLLVVVVWLWGALAFVGAVDSWEFEW